MKQRQRPVSGSTWVASVALHIVLGAGLLHVLSQPYPLSTLFKKRERAASMPVERIGFLRLPETKPNEPPNPGRSGGDGRPETNRRNATPPLVAPTEVPTGIPAPSTGEPTADGGSGPVVGTGGSTRGVVPTFTDPRLWAPPSDVVTAPKTMVERMDSSLAVGIQRAKDSLALVAKANAPPDWSFERGGKKYGIDESGKIWIAGVALPGNHRIQAPPAVAERNQVMARIRAEILEQSQRRLTEDEFRETVKRIRERKDRERERARDQQETRPISQAPNR